MTLAEAAEPSPCYPHPCGGNIVFGNIEASTCEDARRAKLGLCVSRAGQRNAEAIQAIRTTQVAPLNGQIKAAREATDGCDNQICEEFADIVSMGQRCREDCQTFAPCRSRSVLDPQRLACASLDFHVRSLEGFARQRKGVRFITCLLYTSPSPRDRG